MSRDQLEHLIGAAAVISADSEIVRDVKLIAE